MIKRNSRRILTSICLGLSLFALYLVVVETRVAAARGAVGASSLQQTQPTEKTVEQTHKNIQVLNGLPDSQLIPVMDFFSTSLGVKCNYCHVNKDGVWAFESDEKPEKKTARAMVQMTVGINKVNFRGNTDVSCFTCHRGRTQPMGVPQFPLAESAPRPENGGNAGAAKEVMPTADQVIDKYTAALGDAATIEKITSRVIKGSGQGANGATFAYEAYQVVPAKIYVMLSGPRLGVIERGYEGTGNAGWEKRGGGVHDLEGEQLAALFRYPGLVRGTRLKSLYSRVSFGGKDKIDERDVYVLRATTSDNKRERLYFDAQTGLLVRRIMSTPTPIGVVPEQVDYADYRDVEGIKMPFTIKVSSLNGNNSATLKFTEIKLNMPVDEAKFKKPNPPAAATPAKP